jgi:adenosylcobinamide-GDP ribazoletransferase
VSPLAAREASRVAPSPRAAIAFLTRLPVGGGPLTAPGLSAAALWFPAVGLLVGGVMAGVRALAGTVLDPAPSTVLALVAAMLVTGALHEDALADAADAIGAHVPRERRLEILRDPRVGTYGALALVVALVFPLAVLAPLDDGDFLRAALVGHVVGRWTILAQSLLLGAARPDGAGALVRAGAGTTAVATAYTVAVALIAGRPGAGAVALGVAVLLTAGAVALFRRTLGGATGDTFGALTKVVELACYAALVAVWS